ncbi:MAG: flagellar basal body L-ring protein FlgH [Alphaproteobacteria bacterium]
MRRSLLALIGATLTACNGQLDHLGRPPTLTPPGGADMAVAPPAPERVALMPPPPPPPDTAMTASLWQSGPKSLFGDRRARRRGDILTVVIEIDDEAKIRNSTSRGRTGEDSVSIGALYGLATVAQKLMPNGSTLDPAVSASGSTTSTGDGAVTRNEEVTLRLAATVEGVLPNGHLVIRGSQEVRINFELRDLQVSGIVRPEDISRQNVITYDKIADARIVYGGRGQITDMQQPRYGQQIVDLLSPF